MTHAYDEGTVEYAMDNLGAALDYSVHLLKLDGQEFLNLFVISEIANELANGNPKYTTGMSGRDLADEVYAKCGRQIAITEKEVNGDYSPEYWCGWILAYYQWETGISFKKILSVLTFDMLMRSYGVLHEADVSKFEDIADARMRERFPETNLKRIRTVYGCSQAELARKSGVSLRSIQMYEQRNKDINKASADTLYRIAKVLGCTMEALLER